MSAKNVDKHNRFRSITVGFRVSPEENEQINKAVAFSGLPKVLNNDKLDVDVYCGYINNQGVRFVMDGSDQKQLGSKFLTASHSMEIMYPHTSAVLRYIADSYFREAHRDHLQAELHP